MLIRNDPLLPAAPELVTDLQRRLGGTGAICRRADRHVRRPTRKALAEWAGEYNLEGRLRDDDQISNQLVVEIRDVTPEIPPP